MQSEALTSHSPTPTNIATTFGIGEVKGLVEKPVTTTASLALGIGFGAATRGAGFAWGKAEPIVAARAGPLVARSVGFTGSKVIPAAMTTVYGVDVAARTTKGFTDFSAGSVALRSGEITSTEIAPMGAGFVGGYRSPEAIRGGYNYAKTVPASARTFAETTGVKVQGVRSSIPTIDQIKYKWVEVRTPSTAMSQPMPSERFTVARRPGITGSGNKWVEANRIAARSSGTRATADRGTVSGRPSARQEALRLNYNPTAPLTEINSNLASASRQKGILSGIRGTLRGKWDSASATMDEFANLPLKERWKAREAARSSPGTTKGYFGSGKPTGGIQSGVGSGGTTVRSGRQSLELRMGSGINSMEQSLAPQRLEITPSRRTATRSRAYDYEFEYEGRALPRGMSRPKSAQSNQLMQGTAQATDQGVKLSPVFDVVSQQRISQTSMQDRLTRSELISTNKVGTRNDILSEQRRETSRIPIVTTIPRSGLDLASIQSSSLITAQQSRILQVQEPFTETRSVTERIPRTRTTREPGVDRDWITTVTPKPEVPKVPGMWLPDAGGSSGDRPRMRMGVERLAEHKPGCRHSLSQQRNG